MKISLLFVYIWIIFKKVDIHVEKVKHKNNCVKIS